MTRELARGLRYGIPLSLRMWAIAWAGAQLWMQIAEVMK